MKVTVEFR